MTDVIKTQDRMFHGVCVTFPTEQPNTRSRIQTSGERIYSPTNSDCGINLRDNQSGGAIHYATGSSNGSTHQPANLINRGYVSWVIRYALLTAGVVLATTDATEPNSSPGARFPPRSVFSPPSAGVGVGEVCGMTKDHLEASSQINTNLMVNVIS